MTTQNDHIFEISHDTSFKIFFFMTQNVWNYEDETEVINFTESAERKIQERKNKLIINS